MVVVVGLTLKLLPVPTNVPPQEAVYQAMVSSSPPPPPTSERVLEPPLQIVLGVAVADDGSADLCFTVTVTDAQVVVLQSPSAKT
jgi:hypothetical protein